MVVPIEAPETGIRNATILGQTDLLREICRGRRDIAMRRVHGVGQEERKDNRPLSSSQVYKVGIQIQCIASLML